MLFNQIFAATVIFLTIILIPNSGLSQIVFESNELIISSKTERCISEKNGIDHNYNLLSLTNTTENEILVTFSTESWYNGNCATCETTTSEQTISINIPAGETLSGTCSKNYRELMIFHSSNQPFIKEQLTHFAVTDVNVTQN